MSEPKRIQLRRAKGWRKPEGAVVVARPSKWGNPFRVGRIYPLMCDVELRWGEREHVVQDRAHAVALFRAWVEEVREYDNEVEAFGALISSLAGRDLACWCPLDQPCHADVLLEIANAKEANR